MILIIIINVDRSEAETFDKNEYEMHLLHPFDQEKTKLIAYVDRAVDYVKANGISAIMFSHDMASVVAVISTNEQD